MTDKVSTKDIDKTYITDKNWKVTGWHIDGLPRYLAIEHKCVMNPVESGWILTSYKTGSRGTKCQWCQKSAPDGMQASFWFLKEVETNELIGGR